MTGTLILYCMEMQQVMCVISQGHLIFNLKIMWFSGLWERLIQMVSVQLKIGKFW